MLSTMAQSHGRGDRVCLARRPGRRSAGLSEPPAARVHRLPGGQRRRHSRPLFHRATGEDRRQAGDRREPAGRQQQHRRWSCRQSKARRLQHPVHRQFQHGRQPLPVQESAVRHREGFRPGGDLRAHRLRHHGQRQVADQDRRRPHRLSEGPQAEQVRHHQPDRDPGVGVLQAGCRRTGRQRRVQDRAGSACRMSRTARSISW